MFIDDGAGRPGCGISFDDNSIGNQDGCFSRAVMYALNDDDDEAKIMWEFAWPYALTPTSTKAEYKLAMHHDLFNTVGGSVYLLRGDGGLENSESRFLVGFTSVETNREYNPQGMLWLFEVNDAGEATIAMSTPQIGAPGNMDAYRFKPWKSIAGESEDCPDTIFGDGACSDTYSYGYNGAGGGGDGIPNGEGAGDGGGANDDGAGEGGDDDCDDDGCDDDGQIIHNGADDGADDDGAPDANDIVGDDDAALDDDDADDSSAIIGTPGNGTAGATDDDRSQRPKSSTDDTPQDDSPQPHRSSTPGDDETRDDAV